MASDKSRPIVITIVAILEFLAGIITLLAGLAVVFGMSIGVDIPSEFEALGSFMGIAVIASGILAIVIAGGFWNGWKIMWYIGVVVNVIQLLFSVVSIFSGAGFSAVLPILINLIILFYLFRPGVKEFFGIN